MTTRILDDSEVIDYADHHSGTVATQPGKLNPYKLGIELFREIERRWDAGQFGPDWDVEDSIDALTIRDKAGFDADRIAEIEREVRHDVIAFLTNVAEHVGPDSRWVHYGMTSSDVLDTALALQLRDAGALILEGIDRLGAALEARAREHKDTPCVGRTHGVHGEPTTFGLKLLVFALEMRRNRERVHRALAEAAVGKISGAVGTFAHLEPAVEEAVCRRLGIGFEPVATQVVQRDRHAALVLALAQVASSLDKFAVEFRHLARG